MIRTEVEHKNSKQSLADLPDFLRFLEQHLLASGSDEQSAQFQVRQHRDFYAGVQSEVDEYERLLSGGLKAISKNWPMGKQLIAARIALRLTQRELARRLGVDESQVSRDERNDYHGITIDRVERIQEAMGIETQTTYRMASTPSPFAEAFAGSKPAIAAKKPKAVKPVPKAAPSRKGIDKQG